MNENSVSCNEIFNMLVHMLQNGVERKQRFDGRLNSHVFDLTIAMGCDSVLLFFRELERLNYRY